MSLLEPVATSWDERLAENPLLTAVVIGIAALVVLVTVNISWLVCRSLWKDRVQRMHDRFWREHGNQLAAVLGHPEAEAAWLETARAHRPEVLRHCLGEHMMRTSGDYKDGLARLYRGLGLLDGDLVDIHSRRWTVRMRALRRLASVVTSQSRGEIAALANEGGEIRLLVAQIIGRIGTSEEVLPLLESWTSTSRISEYPVHVMLDALSPETVGSLLQHWETLPSASVQRILLGAAAKSVPAACHDLLPRAATHESLEVRIAATHACGTISSPQTFALLGPLAHDAAWEVRAQAAKALAFHRSPEALDMLAAGLCDTSFWVRQNAAAALGRQGPGGVERLRRIVASAGDRYARDAAEHVLTDLGLIEPNEARA